MNKAACITIKQLTVDKKQIKPEWYCKFTKLIVFMVVKMQSILIIVIIYHVQSLSFKLLLWVQNKPEQA